MRPSGSLRTRPASRDAAARRPSTVEAVAALLTILLVVTPAPPAAASKAADDPTRSTSRIVNGLSTLGHPTVVALLAGNPTTAICTGTLIGCRTVLTAAHCVCNGTGSECQPGGLKLTDPATLRVFGSSLPFHQVDAISVPPHYAFGSGGDVALLHLGARLNPPPNTETNDTVLEVNGVSPSRINTQARPPLGTPGSIVGYGITQGGKQDTGVKRQGQVTVDSCTAVTGDTHVCWTFDSPPGLAGEDSNTCNGDSGGPLFVDLGAGPVVAGVTSGGNSSCLPYDNAFDADVFVERQWILDQGGADVLRTSCGDLEPVQSIGTTVHAWQGILDSQNDPLVQSFDVPAGAQRVRITLNGDESNINVFDPDLRVRYAVPPSTDWDCRPYLAGPWEVCEHGAREGTWYVEVSRFGETGSGEVQLTATVFGAEDSAIFSDGFESGNLDLWN